MAGSRNGERPEALDEFMAALQALREQAGKPSFRQMAAKSGAVSHSTLHLTVTGFRLQPWATVREFVRACNGDETEWHARWNRIAQALQDDPGAPGESTGPKASTVRDDQVIPADPVPPKNPGAPGDSENLENSATAVNVPEPADDTAPASSNEPRPTYSTADWNTESPTSRDAWWRRSTSLVAALAVAVFAILSVINVYTSADSTEDTESTSAEPGSDDSTVNARLVHEGDASQLLDDVTYPDNSMVAPGSRFLKVWDLRNIGSVEWRDRYLQRIELPMGPDDCKTPRRIPIPMTSPGQKVRVSVPVEAPSKAPVDCKVHWKMYDSADRLVLPGYRPIFFDVLVREMP